MSSNTDPTSKNTDENSSVNNYINPNTEVRLAYYTYTWDESGFTKQRTAWSSIGSYYYDSSSGDITYIANRNQLIKTAGSSGVAVVDKTLGVIANTNEDVAPIILRADGTYIAGLDNVNIRIGNQYLHTYLNEIDLHFIQTYTDLNTHPIKYTDLWGRTTLNSTYSQLEDVQSSEWLSISLSSRGTVVENTHVVLVGEKGGLNRIENTGFIYNDLTYKRRFNVNDIWMGFYDVIGNWKYNGSSFSIINSYSGTIGDDNTTSTIQFGSISSNDGLITTVNDATMTLLGTYKQQFEYLKNCYTDSNYGYLDYSNTYQLVVSKILSMTNAIDILLGNSCSEYENRLEAPLSKEIFTSAADVLDMYSNVSNVGDVYLSQKSAIVVDRIPWNSTFIDINTTNTATAFAVINDRTKTWNKIDFPTIDETWVKIIESIIDDPDPDGNPHYHYDKLINQFPLRRATADNFSNSDYIKYYGTGGDASSSGSINSNYYQLFNYTDAGDIINPTSMSYYIGDHNITNSANNYRFIGLKTKSESNYSNSEASNVMQITGFNKILLSDLYENPNNYQIPTVEYYWGSTNTGVNSGSSFNVEDIPVNENISYSLSIESALNVDGNFLVAGVGQSSVGSGACTGYNGVFYIPLPTGIDQNEDSQYHDTHWMLTTYTPQANNNATNINLPNSGHVLYKYTKMNDLITTGVFGGFTPYYTTNKLTAGLVNIPQVSYNSSSYAVNNIVYASEAENQAAKINKLISNIAYLVPAFNANVEGDFYDAFEDQITSQSDKCCIITLNSYEAQIIDKQGWMKNADNNGNSVIRNVMYLNLFGYDDGEWNNLSFNVDRKYIFTFNCHIQATNLNLMSDQINYGTPSLLLVGHFRKHYCKSSLNNTTTGNQIYAGETQLIPLLNKPLENPVNNIYNIEGTYTLSWNTTGTETDKAMINNYSFYIPEEYRKPFGVPNGSSFADVYNNIFTNQIWGNGGANIGLYTPLNSNPSSFTTHSSGAYLTGNNIEFLNVLDRIYAFILVGPNVNPNVRYQFVNNTTYQNSSSKILAETDLELFAGVTLDESENGDKSINTSQFNVNKELGIDGGILGINEPMFSMTIQRY